MYRIKLLDNAVKDLKKLDKNTAKRITSKIKWLAENLENTKLEALTADFSGVFKLRVGDYRIIFEIIHDEELIIIHLIEHRRTIYK